MKFKRGMPVMYDNRHYFYHDLSMQPGQCFIYLLKEPGLDNEYYHRMPNFYTFSNNKAYFQVIKTSVTLAAETNKQASFMLEKEW